MNGGRKNRGGEGGEKTTLGLTADTYLVDGKKGEGGLSPKECELHMIRPDGCHRTINKVKSNKV